MIVTEETGIIRNEIETWDLTIVDNLVLHFLRKSDVVEVTTGREIASLPIGENVLFDMLVKDGFRPYSDIDIIFAKNANSVIDGNAIFRVNHNGEIRYTNGSADNRVYSATTCYLTLDDIPE
jgi:hypothetical protein